MKSIIFSTIIFIGLFLSFSITFSKVEKNAKNLTYSAMFAALTAIGAFIRVPLPIIPFTMQLFFVVFAGIFLGSKLGLISQLIYVLIGLSGVPVFTKGGGLNYVFQPSFGYLIGFILAAYFAGLVVEKFKKNNFKTYMVASLVAVITIYLCGVPYLYFINSIYLIKAFTFKMAIYYGFLVTIPGDIISCIILCVILPSIIRVVSRNNQLKNS